MAVFRREPLWKVSMNVRLQPSVRCTFDAQENALRVVLKELDSEKPDASQTVIYAFKVRIPLTCLLAGVKTDWTWTNSLVGRVDRAIFRISQSRCWRRRGKVVSCSGVLYLCRFHCTKIGSLLNHTFS